MKWEERMLGTNTVSTMHSLPKTVSTHEQPLILPAALTHSDLA